MKELYNSRKYRGHIVEMPETRRYAREAALSQAISFIVLVVIMAACMYAFISYAK